jgi:hypothetical protein
MSDRRLPRGAVLETGTERPASDPRRWLILATVALAQLTSGSTCRSRSPGTGPPTDQIPAFGYSRAVTRVIVLPLSGCRA